MKELAADASSLTGRATLDIQAVISGRTRRPRALLSLAGPAIVASIAYMDPGNFATNIQAGAKYGYSLLWVVLSANAGAMLYQALSAKLGLVTGRNLAELCRDALPTPAVVSMWLLSEIAAMATDLAEFVGGAMGVSIVLHLPLILGMIVTAIVTYGLLQFERAGFRPLELVIAALIGVIGLAYLGELMLAPIAWSAVLTHTFVPQKLDNGALILSVGIVGATVMPHVLFLHSGLTQNRVTPRDDRERRILLTFSNLEVVAALGVAGLINVAMVIMAAGTFHARHPELVQLDDAYRTLLPLLGPAAALLFLAALIASGLSSSVVGTMAGQMIMQGFVGFRIPVALRRLVTMVPAFVVIGLGVNPTNALILSQVVLSIALPVPMAMLVRFTSSHRLMGEYCNRPVTVVVATLGAVLVVALNVALVWSLWD
jgi:manganese transport protein